MNKRYKDSTCAKTKDTHFSNQLQSFYDCLKEHIMTCTMVSEFTGIPQKNCCRYKRDLEKAGLLWEVKYSRCPVTHFDAWFITCNPRLKPDDNQLKLFADAETTV